MARSEFGIEVEHYLKTFQTFKPLAFKGKSNSIVNKDGLLKIVKLFDSMICLDNRKVVLGLEREIEIW